MEKFRDDFTRMHPVALLLYLMGVMLVTMLTLNPVLLAVSFVIAAIIGSLLCGKRIWKTALWLFVPVLFFSAGILPLFSHNGVTPLFYINSQAVTLESVWYGSVMSVMLVTVFLWFQIGSRLLDGEKLLFLFGKVLPSLGLLVSMVFRMLPLLRNRFREIREARRGLGFHEPQAGFVKRCRYLGKECSILISWSLENSIETSLSMESRGYGTGRRTSFHLFRVHREDIIFALLFFFLISVTAVSVGMGSFQAFYFPAFHMAKMQVHTISGIVAFAIAGLLPLLLEGVKK